MKMTWLAAATLLFAGCSDLVEEPNAEPPGSESTDSEEPAESWQFDVDVDLDGATLRASGTTNLPDGTLVSIDARRGFVDETSEDGWAIVAESVSVNDGVFVLEVDLSDEAEALLPGAEAMDSGFTALSDHLDVCVTVKTGQSLRKPYQEDAGVREAIGESGEAFEGHPTAIDVTLLGSGDQVTWLQVGPLRVDHAPPLDAFAARGETPEVRDLSQPCLGF